MEYFSWPGMPRLALHTQRTSSGDRFFFFFESGLCIYTLRAVHCTIMKDWVGALSTIPREHLRVIVFFFYNHVFVYMYLYICICIYVFVYIVCVSTHEGSYDYLLVRAVIDFK